MSNKVVFRKIFLKNFRSISNSGMEFEFDKSPKTLVCSKENGSGKSTMLVHGLYYVLFSKSYGKDNKISSLVNSRNNKDCYGEVEFDTNGKSYVVKRGMKPSVFEIWEDGVKIENEAALKDPQKYLESVMGFDDKSFVNQIVLGKDRFVPFASMTAGDRRKHVEQILDMVIFSQMNEVTKEKIKVINKEKSELEYHIHGTESKVTLHQNTIDVITSSLQNKNSNIQAQIIEVESEMKSALEKGTLTKSIIDSMATKTVDYDELVKEANKYGTIVNRLETKKQTLESEISRFESLGECPTCKQDVSAEHKHGLTKDQKEQLEKIIEAIPQAKDIFNNKEAECKVIEAIKIEITKHQQELNLVKSSYENLVKQKEGYAKMMVDSDEQSKIDEAEASKAEQEEKLANQKILLDGINEQLLYNQGVLVMLKDDGIKASMVRDYLPFINTKINTYLDKMNLYLNLNMTDEFDLEMLSPDRKGQTLGSLSSGQLTRIDLAVLFAWRAIAASKASVDSNILILDEILEALSAQGVSDFMEFYATEFGTGSNLFVISQRSDEFSAYFDQIVEYELRDGYTVEVVTI